MPTRIGVLSDSHGAAGLTRRAVAALVRRGATMFIHCGDIETTECLEELAGLDAHIVFGNCDRPASLRKHAEALGLTVHHPLGELVVDGARVAFTHGHKEECLRRPLESKAAWLFHGHTHAKCDVILQSTRVVNPGALHNADPFTVALVTPATGQVEFLEIS